MKDIGDTLTELASKAQSGELAKASASDLERYVSALCWSQAYAHFPKQQYDQVSDTVRLLVLQRHIDAAEQRGSKNQNLVTWLAAVSLLSSVVQIYVSLATQ